MKTQLIIFLIVGLVIWLTYIIVYILNELRVLGLDTKSDKYIVQGRRTGKTTKAIEESARTGIPILVHNQVLARYIYDTALLDMGLDIPKPLTVKDLKSPLRYGNSVSTNVVIVDEAISVLEYILETKIHMATISDETLSNEREDYK